MASIPNYYEINTQDAKQMYKAAKELNDRMWSNHCDLDYWINDMSRTSKSDCGIPKHVLKMALKHLRDDLYNMTEFLSRIQLDYTDEK